MLFVMNSSGQPPLHQHLTGPQQILQQLPPPADGAMAKIRFLGYRPVLAALVAWCFWASVFPMVFIHGELLVSQCGGLSSWLGSSRLLAPVVTCPWFRGLPGFFCSVFDGVFNPVEAEPGLGPPPPCLAIHLPPPCIQVLP
jgi:hypothetical protein